MMARSLAALAVTLLFAAPAFAQDEPPPPPATGVPGGSVAAPAAAAPVAAVEAKKYAKKRVIEFSGGLSFGYDTYKPEGSPDSYNTFDLTLYPSVYYFVINGLAVGGRLGLGYSKSWVGDANSNGFTFSILPSAQYVFDLGSKIYPYAGVSFGYSVYRSGASGSDSLTTNQFNVIFEGGVKMNFGHGLVGLGLEIPVVYNSPDVDGASGFTQAGVRVMTSYGIWF